MKTIKQLNEEAVLIGLHETYHHTEKEALMEGKYRCEKYNRNVYVFQMESGYMVCVHGVQKIGFTLIKTYHRAK